ncbi:ABC transporter permease [Acuticoccus yangtzensis]|uniref:ABC transporter permease n=1 Tax=Acuticoccus yangtzensis TaxID=1443441 RepID=UPI0009496D45|nr:ABC transporter permease [Acuticoccus yangtzensis]ORE93386.1 ABC transporter permease [Stappia sp. 22II-S9-Z10]
MAAVTAEGPRGGRLVLSATSLIGPATVVVALGVIGPLLILFRYSLNDFDPRMLMIDALTPKNYIEFFTDPYFLAVFFVTVRVALMTTVICLILGFPLAYVLARTQTRFKNLLLIAVVVPLFVGNAVRAAGWMTLFGSRGFLSMTLMDLGITTEPTEIMFTETAVIIGIIAVNLPYMVLTLQSVLEGINRNLEEAAFSLGAAPLTMVRRVLWPMALPGIAAGGILTFILAMNAYATPVLLGGPEFRMMAPVIYSQFQLNNWPSAAAVAFVLMGTTLLLTIAASVATRQRFRD